jgi:hypothetical protein
MAATLRGGPGDVSFVTRILQEDDELTSNVSSPFVAFNSTAQSGTLPGLSLAPSMAFRPPAPSSPKHAGLWVEHAADLLQLALCDETKQAFDEPLKYIDATVNTKKINHRGGLSSPIKTVQRIPYTSTASPQPSLSTASKEGRLTLFQFIQYFVGWGERLYSLQRGGQTMPRDEFLHCKKLLFSAFYEMDRDDDGAVSFKDMTDYLLQQRAATSELSKEQRFDVDHTFSFKSAAAPVDDDGHSHGKSGGGGGSTELREFLRSDQEDEEEYNAISRHAAAGDGSSADDVPQGGGGGGHGGGHSITLDFEPPTLVRKLSGGNRSKRYLGALSRTKGFFFIDKYFNAQESLGSSSCSSSAAAGANLDILDFDSSSMDDLVITAHADKMLRVWSSRDARLASIRNGWHVVFQHQCTSVPTSVCAHSKSDRVFTGTSNGDVSCWRFSNSIIADYKKGDRAAFDSLLTKTWSGGSTYQGGGASRKPPPLHTDAVKALQPLDHGGIRIASCSLDGTAAIVDVTRGTRGGSLSTTSEIQRFSSSRRGMMSLAVCEPYSFIATGGYDVEPCVWDYTSSNAKPSKLIDSADRHQDVIRSVCLLDNGNGGAVLLASIDSTAKLKIWDLRMMRCLQSTSLLRTGSQQKANSNPAMAGGLPRGHGAKGGPHAGSMVVSPWAAAGAPALLVSGTHLLSVSARTDALPRRMASESAAGIDFDLQSGMILALHTDSSITQWNQGEARGQIILQPPDWKLAGESIRTMTMFADRGRRALLSTSLGRVLTVNTETGSITHICKAFDGVPLKRSIIGSFDARPFVVSLSAHGELFCWNHPAIPSHIVLPQSVEKITAMELGTTDGELWIGGDDGCLYHVDLPEGLCSDALLRPGIANRIIRNAPALTSPMGSRGVRAASMSLSTSTPQIESLVLLRKLGIMFLFRSDGELLLFNANFNAEELHSSFPFPSGVHVRHCAGISIAKKFGMNEGYVAVGDDEGLITIFKVGSRMVHPTAADVRKKYFQKLLFRKDLFSVPSPTAASSERSPGGIASLAALQHWNAFAVASEDCVCAIIDRHGVVLTMLTQQMTPWPLDSLPKVTNEARSRRVISLLHQFFAKLRRRVAARRTGGSPDAMMRRGSMLVRRQSRIMSFSRQQPTSGDPVAPAADLFAITGAALFGSFSMMSSSGDTPVGARAKVNIDDAAIRENTTLVVESTNNYSVANFESLPSNKTFVLSERTPRRPQSARAPGQGAAARPSSAPQNHPKPTAPVVADRQASIIGSSCIKRPILKHSLDSFTGQIAVVSSSSTSKTSRTTISEPVRDTPTILPPETAALLANVQVPYVRVNIPSAEDECSSRAVLPTALTRVVQQQALDEKELPPSVLWAPIPRPPSPLQSRRKTKPRTNQ